MKSFLAVLTLSALAASTKAGDSGYGAPAHEAYQSQTFRHVYVHVAPDEPADVQSRSIRVPGGDKHVNIIFVKAPSSSSHSETEVILPEQDHHKNLVYVLTKKGEATSTVNIRRPAAPSQQKPEVYFIKYGNQGGYNGGGGGIGGGAIDIGSGGIGATAVRTPSSEYGAL